jgi:broad specificity phosphatase PhoE
MLVALLLGSISLAVSPAPATGASGSPTLVLLVRHAEKATEPADDPPLTPAGTQRAQDLAAALADAGVTAILTTQLKRSRDTAQPLATALRLTPEVVPVGSEGADDAHVAAVAAAVRRHAGEIVLVVGHSDSIPLIIAALGGPQMPEICETLFANLFVLVPGATDARLIRTYYGAADAPPQADCEQ